MCKLFLYPFSFLFRFVSWFRRSLYKYQALNSYGVDDLFIISVGNLTVGGSGKTPFVSYLVNYFEKQNIKVAILSRGYKGACIGVGELPQELEPMNQMVKKFGDEPVMLKFKHKNTPVFVSKKRIFGARKIKDVTAAKILILDDAFQHLQIKRDLNILLVDGTKKMSDYEVMPLGKAREPISQAKRADIIVYTKEKWGIDSELNKVKNKFNQISNVPQFSLKNKGTSFELRNMSKVNVIKSLDELKKQKIALVSGLANNKQFYNSLTDQKLNVEKHFEFADHYWYTKNDIKKIIVFCKEHKISSIVTTEKDFVKLKDLNIPLDIIVCSQEYEESTLFEEYLLNAYRNFS